MPIVCPVCHTAFNFLPKRCQKCGHEFSAEEMGAANAQAGKTEEAREWYGDVSEERLNELAGEGVALAQVELDRRQGRMPEPLKPHEGETASIQPQSRAPGVSLAVGWVFLAISAIFVCVGLYTMFNYESWTGTGKIVGGDAYNYMIIATRGVGLICTGVVSALIGVGAILTGIARRH